MLTVAVHTANHDALKDGCVICRQWKIESHRNGSLYMTSTYYEVDSPNSTPFDFSWFSLGICQSERITVGHIDTSLLILLFSTLSSPNFRKQGEFIWAKFCSYLLRCFALITHLMEKWLCIESEVGVVTNSKVRHSDLFPIIPLHITELVFKFNNLLSNPKMDPSSLAWDASVHGFLI